MKKLISIICCALALTLCLTACGQSAASNEGGQTLAKGGVLVLSVNPEIAVAYDEEGNVTGVTARSDEALAIINSCSGLIGQPTREVVTDLVTAIGKAGYFVEEIEGERRQITLEIEPGSSLPRDTFLDEVVEDIRNAVNQYDWFTPLVVEGESDFGISDYIDTDYGIGNDGVTDYEGESAYGATTDYNETDYGLGSNGVTNYDFSDYGTTDGWSDYSDGNSNYDDGWSDYSDGNSNYDDGQSDYYDASDYGDSDYE